MSDENIAYTAKVNAAAWLIRKARKIARRLVDTTREQRQAIENEIAVIGMRLYSEACEQPHPETTHDPGEDHELEAYVAAVRELVPDAERWFVANDYHHKFSVEQSAERWREYVSYSKGRAQRFAVALLTRHGDSLAPHDAWGLATEMADAEPKDG